MFNSVISTTMTLSAFLKCILSALVMGLLIAVVFSVRTRHTASLVMAYTIVPPVVTIIIMLVNGNIGAGLGVAGAFALVRFRSVPGTAKEITGLLLATAVGLTCGMGYIGIAALFFVIISAVVLVLTLLGFGDSKSSVRQLKITIPENLDYEGLFDDLFAQYTTRHELVKVKTTNMGTLYELTYIIDLKNAEVSKQFMDDIRCRNGNLNIICGRETDKEML